MRQIVIFSQYRYTLLLQRLSYIYMNIWGFGGAIVRERAFHLWDRGFDSRYGLVHDSHVKRVGQRSTESRFLRVL
jgi:hypothetical protein